MTTQSNYLTVYAIIGSLRDYPSSITLNEEESHTIKARHNQFFKDRHGEAYIAMFSVPRADWDAEKVTCATIKSYKRIN